MSSILWYIKYNTMKFLKTIQLLALIPFIFVVGCKKDDEPVPVQPQVLSTSPAAGAVDVPTNSLISMTFTKEMNPSTINASTFTLMEGTNIIEGTFTYEGVTSMFTPSSDLKGNSNFIATLNIGAQDITGLPLKNKYEVSFNTGDAPDVDAPTATANDPLNDAVDVSADKVISITFNEEMDASTIIASSFIVKQGANSVSGAISYADKTATFTPNSDLGAGLKFDVTITTSVTDMAGNAIANAMLWSFTTDALPTVTSITPLDNATDVARNKVISINFSDVMDASTINSSSFILMEGSNTIAGTYEHSSKSASFIPSSNLGSNLTYTVTVNTNVKDVGGNSIAAAKIWTFTTGSVSGLQAVNLRASGNYVILAKTAINNSPTSAITGDLGLSPAATTFVTGFSLTDATGYATSAQITGKVYAADMASPTSSNLTTAVDNMLTAYTDAAGRPTPDYLDLATGNIGGQTLLAGLYKWNTTVTIPDDVIISGSADDVWIFQISNDVTMSAAKNITLQGGAQAKNIFWQVAGEVVIGANSHFEGVILCQTGITLQTGASFKGRALAQTAVILDSNAVIQP